MCHVPAAADLFAALAISLAGTGVRLPCWSIDSYWHIGEAWCAIECSGMKLEFNCEHAEAEDEESDASEAE